ncbi:MAG TPA: TolC family protein, partial [Bacteroidales bacterium]|nr:TolC family protein [Bacteroidales bacterium]
TEKIKLRTSQLDYLQKAVSYTMELLKYTSTTNYLDVLTSEVSLLSAQLNSIDDKLQQLQSVVALYRSLGGGWKE